MDESSAWWLLTGLAVAAELMTGTFYLLMVAIGLAAAAIGAHLGLTITAQCVLAALGGGGSVVAWHLWRRWHPPPAHDGASETNLDVGQTVHVAHWHHGSATVDYRGAQWQADLLVGCTAQAGLHRIAQISGNRLVLEPVEPH